MKKVLSYVVVIALFASLWMGVSNVQAKVIKKAGWYYSDLRKSLGSDKKDADCYTYAKKLKFKKNSFVIYGTVGKIRYSSVEINGKKINTMGFQGPKYKAGKKIVKVSKKCKFFKAKNSESSRKKISYKKLKKLALPLKKGSSKNYCTLAWKIKTGKVVRMEIF